MKYCKKAATWLLMLTLVSTITATGWARGGGGNSFRSSSVGRSNSSYSRSSSNPARQATVPVPSSNPHYVPPSQPYRNDVPTRYDSRSNYNSRGGGFFSSVRFFFTLAEVLLGTLLLFGAFMVSYWALKGVLGLLAILCLTIPLTIIELILFAVIRAAVRSNQAGGPAADIPEKIFEHSTTDISRILVDDPNFSLPVFREFAVLLYCQAQTERAGQFGQCAPYLSPQAQKTLQQRNHPGARVLDVVVGTFAVEAVLSDDQLSRLRVNFEANYRESGGQGMAYIANESWTFVRKQGVHTKEPQGAARLVCPSCGYNGEFGVDGACPSCGQSNRNASLDWLVESIDARLLEPYDPSKNKGGSELGTDEPTVIHADLPERLAELTRRSPDFQWNAFRTMAEGVFLKLQEAWTKRDLSLVRPHESDVVYRTHRYWIEDFRRQGRVNRLEKIKILNCELSNVVLDAYYDSVTVRIRAEMLDYTVEEKSGHIVDGSDKKMSNFTEYWTFIRRKGHQSKGEDLLSRCPSCGAALDRVNQAGTCEYCDSLITTGDFDWVLSCIEQDEVYALAL